MNENQIRVTVRRLEKVPTQFYVQAPQMKAKARTKVKVEVADSLWAERKRLSRALSFMPPLPSDFSGTLTATCKKWFLKAKSVAVGGASALLCLLTEHAKRLAFSFGVSGSLAAIACLVLISTCSIGCQVSLDGQVLGTIKNKTEYNQIIESINYEIAQVSNEAFALPIEPELSTRFIQKGAFSNIDDVRERIKAACHDMLPAYGVYAENQLLFALPNEQAALFVLESYKNSFLKEGDEVSAEYCEEVTVAHRFVPKASLKTADGAAARLAEGKVITHSLSADENIYSVADKYGITIDDILQTNPIDDLENVSLAELKIRTGEPLLSVKTVALKHIEEEIPFGTIEKKDPSSYEGNIWVEQAGAPGARAIDAYVTWVNGVETDRYIVSEHILSAAVDEIIFSGTKERPSPIGTGVLAVPTNGSLSSRFGSRWGRSHTGIDFAASVGTDIYATDNGTVIYSEYNNGGYGYLIQIDHGNGIVTYYGHCSELLVPEGQVVAKGDLIARVGNTGRSTGPHLHFEVRKNGEPVDPLHYLKGLN
ncbi:MAG: peptidoglycan DD-metalloendopeptidase family protein [Clostridia bacterium]|nr:peptidoglycan DD-metalloendopeptidase family protein [Clostridia bacterium]